MVEFSQIDKELNVYKKHRVFLWGAGVRGAQARHILNAFDIGIEAFVDSNPDKCGGEKTGIPIISFDELCQRAEKDDACLVQISCENETEIIYKLEKQSIAYIAFEEFNVRTDALENYILMNTGNFKNLLCDHISDRHRNGVEKNIIQYLSWNVLAGLKSCNLLVSAPKCGNTSLAYSFSGHVLATGHTFEYIEKNVIEFIKKQNVNIVCGVRDAIGQRLSLCYELVDLYWDMEEFWDGGGDVDAIFNRYFTQPVDNDCEYTRHLKYAGYNYSAADFFDKQLKKHFDIDVYNYPFDKDKGYIIIRKDNINVMIYQMEKMNGLGKEFSDFLGCGGEYTLQKHNDADHKWYHDSYKKAQKEIKFDRKYFLECYEGKYMKHFYSDEDIERFKLKWIGNVRD